jgi:hypothetical protein
MKNKYKSYAFILFILVAACSSEKKLQVSHKEKVESDALYYGKKLGDQIYELPNSILVKGILRDYLKNISDISFYKNLTYSDFLFDANSFLLDQNVPLSPNFCNSKDNCPRISCRWKDNNEFLMKVSGECFNDVFVFLGDVDYTFYTNNDSSNPLSFFYKVNLNSWQFKSVETKEYILYEGNITFYAISSQNEKIIKRDMAIFGNSEIIYNGLKNKLGIQFESVFDYYNSSTGFISFYYAQVQNPFCVSFVFDMRPKFTCSYKFFVKKYILQFSSEEIHVLQSNFETYNVGGNLAWILTESNMRIHGENLFQDSLSQATCRFLDGQIKFTSGSEELTLNFDNKSFDNQPCNFLCPSQWYWKDTKNSKDFLGYGCLPGSG